MYARLRKALTTGTAASHLDAMASCGDGKRKLWNEESMEAAMNGVQNENMRGYNVPFETLRRRVNGSVNPGCKPGRNVWPNGRHGVWPKS